MKSRVLRTTICILMVIAILCFSFSVYADDELVIPTDDPQTIINETEDYFWRLWIWGALKSFGINISLGDVVEYTDALDEYMQNLILSYLETIPSISNWNQWIFPWVGGINSSGFFEGNASFVEDVNDFAEWLIGEYGLTDDSTTQLENYEYIIMDGIKFPVYPAPLVGYRFNVDGVYQEWYSVWKVGSSIGYNVLEGRIGFLPDHTYYLESGVYFRVDTTERKVKFASDPNFEHILVGGANWTGNTNFLNGFTSDYDDLTPSPSSSGWYAYNGTGMMYFFKNYKTNYEVAYHYSIIATIEYKSPASSSTFNDRECSSLLHQDWKYEDYFMVHRFNGSATTSTVLVPSDDTDYTPGDSIVIIDDEPNYVVIEFPDSMKVSNLPAGIIPTQLEDPQLVEAYRPIKSFISLSKDGLECVIGLVNEMPSHAIVCIYAIMGGVIILGIMKIFREH